MRIRRIETYANEWVAFVRVETEDGAEGWGQTAPYHADVTAQILHRQVAPHALGQDALDPEALGRRVLEAEHKFPGSHLCRALGGLDTALWTKVATGVGLDGSSGGAYNVFDLVRGTA